MKYQLASLLAVFVVSLVGCAGSAPAPTFPTGDWATSTNFSSVRVDANTVRIGGFERSGPVYGMCATLAGEPLTVACVPDNELKVNTAMASDLSKTDYRLYSRVLDVNFSQQANVGGVQASGSVITKRMQFVNEWARWRVELTPTKSAQPYVCGADVGIAVRLILDVTLTTTDANLASNFGFGQLAAALATNSATVMVRYDTVGTTYNILPESSPVTITSVDSYLAVTDSFYNAVRALSVAYAEYSAPVAQPAPGAAAAKPKNHELFSPGILAYYVSNIPSMTGGDSVAFSLGYTRAAAAITKKSTCAAFLKEPHNQVEANRMTAFTEGARRAYSDIASITKCDDTAVHADVADVATTLLRPGTSVP